MPPRTPSRRPGAVLNTQTVLARGWTHTAIKNFLGEPYWREECHKYGVGDFTTNWYRAADVKAAERRKAFKTIQAKKTARSEAAKKAVETRRAQTMAFAEAMEIRVPKRDLLEVQKAACDSYNQRASDRDKYGGASPDSEPKFLDRITVNYIRHEMSNYEAAIHAQFGRVGVDDAIQAVRSRVYEAIGATYPDLKRECLDQEIGRALQKSDEWRLR